MLQRQDLFVLLPYYLGFSKVRNFIYRFQQKPVTRIVVFHDILPEALVYFKANLRFLKRHTNVVSLNDFFSSRLSANKINVIITFDDGYKSWVTHAIPALKELGLPATFFVTSGFVDLSKDDEAKFMRSSLFVMMGPRETSGGLRAEEVRRIVEEGFAIGGHTLNHCHLGKLRDRALAKREIVEDKMRLERITGERLRYFAYPTGSYHNSEIDLIGLLKEAGYRGAVTTISGFNGARSNPYQLHREITGASMTRPVFKARVTGSSDAIRFIKQRIIRDPELD